jgi:hypothetical protein
VALKKAALGTLDIQPYVVRRDPPDGSRPTTVAMTARAPHGDGHGLIGPHRLKSRTGQFAIEVEDVFFDTIAVVED